MREGDVSMLVDLATAPFPVNSPFSSDAGGSQSTRSSKDRGSLVDSRSSNDGGLVVAAGVVTKTTDRAHAIPTMGSEGCAS